MNELWAGPKRTDLVHLEKSFHETQGGETQKIGIGERSANSGKAAAERAQNQENIKQGKFGRVKNVDPNAPAVKYKQPAPPKIESISPKPIEVHTPNAGGPKTAGPKATSRAARGPGAGAVKAMNVVGLGLIGLDLAEAENNEQRVDLAGDTAKSMAVFWGVSRIPYVGTPIAATAGAAMTGYAAGDKFAERVMPDSANVAIGATIIHDLIGANKEDAELLQDVDIVDASLEGAGEAVYEDLLGATPDDRDALENMTIPVINWRPFAPK